MADAASGSDADRPDAFTVAELNERIAAALDGEPFEDVTCLGEVLDCHESDSAVYFTLTDGEAELRCVLWRWRYRDMDVDLEDGAEVVVRGPVDYWEEGGEISLKPREVRVVGEGDRLARIERLRRDLRERGWFAEEQKRALPDYPARVGVVTSRDGDARHDVQQAIHERYPDVEIVLRHASVQGERAPEELAAGIRALDGEVDAIVVGRGGGSDADLDAFNTETVAEAVVECGTPVVAAVGHREDRTIADETADAAAITPTAAGAEVVRDKREEFARLRDLEADLGAAYEGFVRQRLDGLHENLESAFEALEREREHEREKREAIARTREEAREVPRAYKVALVVLALLVLVLLGVVLGVVLL